MICNVFFEEVLQFIEEQSMRNDGVVEDFPEADDFFEDW